MITEISYGGRIFMIPEKNWKETSIKISIFKGIKNLRVGYTVATL
jgi:hypothetical protein